MRGIRANGAAVRQLRAARGLSQEQLAIAADCDERTVRKAEQGSSRLDFRTIAGIAQALGADVMAIVSRDETGSEQTALHLHVVRQWHAAFVRSDVEALLPLHTDDTVLEIPSSEGLPAAGNFHGIDELRQHLTEVFALFQVTAVRDDDFSIHALENLVFLRTTATIRFLSTGKFYTSRHFNEFEFRDGKIARRTAIADYGPLREIIQP